MHSTEAYRKLFSSEYAGIQISIAFAPESSLIGPDMADLKNQIDFRKAGTELLSEFESRWKSRRIGALLDEVQDLEMSMQRPDFWDDSDTARDISMKKSELEKKTEPWTRLRGDIEDFPDLTELTFEEYQDSREAVSSLLIEFRSLQDRFEDLLMSAALEGEDDKRNAIIIISSGAGGTESQDWTEMLVRMYSRWFEKRHFRTETMDLQQGEEAGLKSATFLVRGENAFGFLKCENGVHRLVRISPFDSNKRRHTSFASVYVMPELDDDVQVDIDDKDLRIDTYRASGAGGQHVNKTDSAIRITHIPTGTVVQCQNERSQHKNKASAMKMLEGRLHQIEKEKMSEDLEKRSGDKMDVAWGSQIRSYVFHPYKMVKDLRTEHETSNVEGVMDGDLDPFVNAYLRSMAIPGFSDKEKAGKEKANKS